MAGKSLYQAVKQAVQEGCVVSFTEATALSTVFVVSVERVLPDGRRAKASRRITEREMVETKLRPDLQLAEAVDAAFRQARAVAR